VQETDLAQYVDPLGGSVTVDRLVDEIEAEAQDWLDRIAGRGGLLPCLRTGWLGAEIDDLAAADSGPVVGVVDESPSEVERSLLRDQRRTGIAGGRRRPFARVGCPEPLRGIRDAARLGVNVMPFLVDAARARASVEQMCTAVAAGAGCPPHPPRAAARN
jgi:methylmalonyl-CoA mutase N-terminal domain/subunit